MAKKITELAEITTVASDDLLVVKVIGIKS